MSETETVPQHNRYEVIAYGHGEAPVYYEEFGSYQGEWIMLARGEKGFVVYKGSYGSCSGCDSYEAESWYDENGWPLDKARQFAADYAPFIVIPLDTMQSLCVERTLGEVLPVNLREEYDHEMPPHDVLAGSFMVAAKLDQGWPLTLEDVQSTGNQELRQRALKAFGYERWLKEMGGQVIHRDGDDELIRAGDIVFAHVKDSSTERRYLLRVPPTIDGQPTTRVKQAIAWTFGMTEAQYQPVRET